MKQSGTNKTQLSVKAVEKGGYVYILTNQRHTVLYTGVTSNLINRIWEHKNKLYKNSFTNKYNCDKLVYYRSFPHIEEAIVAEKKIKGGSRLSKLKLIDVANPGWKDLADDLVIAPA